MYALEQEKKALSFEDIEAQMATELPDRDTMLVTVVITDFLDVGDITLTVANNDVAAQVCSNILAVDSTATCEVQQ